ncbi:hypothetical protein SAMN05428936_10419 [Pelagibacterium halotolerans]|nr:hypothetical protein SAMN05428936_10419 [Pelagibacterium halotolerans]
MFPRPQPVGWAHPADVHDYGRFMDVVGVVVLARAKCAGLFDLRIWIPVDCGQKSFRTGTMQWGMGRLQRQRDNDYPCHNKEAQERLPGNVFRLWTDHCRNLHQYPEYLCQHSEPNRSGPPAHLLKRRPWKISHQSDAAICEIDPSSILGRAQPSGCAERHEFASARWASYGCAPQRRGARFKWPRGVCSDCLLPDACQHSSPDTLGTNGCSG